MTTYIVKAARSDGWWALSAKVGKRTIHSQAKRLDRVEDVMREAIGAALEVDDPMLELDNADIEILVSPEIDWDVRQHIDNAHKSREESARLQTEAATEIRKAAHLLRDSGLPVRDVGAVLEVSHQRAHQLLSDAY